MYGEECGAEMSIAKVASESIKERLQSKQARLEKQLADTNAALEAMEANPEVAKVMELVMKASR